MTTAPTTTQARDALAYIPTAMPRDEWAKLAMSIKSEFPDATGFDLFDSWSQTDPDGYDAASVRDTWRSVKAGGGVGIGTLFHIAKQHGYAPTKGSPPSAAERDAHRTRAMSKHGQEEVQQAARQQMANEAAALILNEAAPATGHEYLTRKGIKPHGVKSHGHHLLIPMRDTSGKLHSLQTIAPDGGKRFQPGGRVKGCYHAIGKPEGVLIVCEGYATGASIHEATRHAVAAAFNAGNLRAVAEALRVKYPELRLILAADDDVATPGNPGLTKATEAARAVGGYLAIPDFGSDRPDGATDFNDLHQLAGADAVRACIDMAVLVEAAPVAQADGDRNRPEVVLINGTDLQPEPVRWLWPDWLALGKLHILAGAPGQGKTTIAIACAATVTIGGRWPDGSRCEQGNILIWSGEDDPADTLLPRLLAAGADRARCYFVSGTRIDGELQSFDPARDMGALEAQAHRIGGIKLLIVDPVVSAVAGDSHKNTEVRRALQPLVDLASRLDAAVLGISHFSKGGQGSDPASRVVGSIAFTAVARVVLVAAKVKGEDDEQDRRILARGKSNIGPDDGGFEYHIDQSEPLPGIHASYIAWGKPVAGTARELLAEPEERPNDDAADACDLLRGELDPVLWTDSEKATQPLKAAGFSKKQIWKASQKLGVERRKDGMKGGWMWRLRDPNAVAFHIAGEDSRPEDSPEGSEDSNISNGEPSESSGALESSAAEVL